MIDKYISHVKSQFIVVCLLFGLSFVENRVSLHHIIGLFSVVGLISIFLIKTGQL